MSNPRTRAAEFFLGWVGLPVFTFLALANATALATRSDAWGLAYLAGAVLSTVMAVLGLWCWVEWWSRHGRERR